MTQSNRRSSRRSSFDRICRATYEYARGQRPLFGTCGWWGDPPHAGGWPPGQRPSGRGLYAVVVIRAASASFAGGFVPLGNAGGGLRGADRDAAVFRPRPDVAATLPGCLGTRPGASSPYRLLPRSARPAATLCVILPGPGLAPDRKDGLGGTDSAGIHTGLAAMMACVGVMHFMRPGTADAEGVLWNFIPWQ
jgi:hypothetical protein